MRATYFHLWSPAGPPDGSAGNDTEVGAAYYTFSSNKKGGTPCGAPLFSLRDFDGDQTL
jgi:hypothetical protein